MSTDSTNRPLPLGVVDRAKSRFVLRHGNDDPKKWVPVAWLDDPDGKPVVEIAEGLDPALRAEVEREVAMWISDDYSFRSVAGFLVDGVVEPCWQLSLVLRICSTANCYGDLHWGQRSGDQRSGGG